MAFDGIGFRGLGGVGGNRPNLSIKPSPLSGFSTNNSAASSSSIFDDSGRRAVGRGIENLNSLITSVNLTSEKLGELVELTDGLIDLAKAASRESTKDETRAELDRKFQSLSNKFGEITDNTDLQGVDLLSKDGLSKLFEAVGISTENSQPIADIFGKIAKGASEEGELASTKPHARQRQIPTRQVETTTTSATSELLTATTTGGPGEVADVTPSAVEPEELYSTGGEIETSSNATSADGRYSVIYEPSSGELTVYDTVTDGTNLLATFTAGVYDPSNIAISADGLVVAFTSAENLNGTNSRNYDQVFTIDVNTKDILRITDTQDYEENFRGLAINSDGTNVAFTSHTIHDESGVRSGFDAASYVLNIAENRDIGQFSSLDGLSLVDVTNDLAVLQFGTSDGNGIERLYGAARTNLKENDLEHTQLFSFAIDYVGGIDVESLGLAGDGDEAVTEIRLARSAGNFAEDVYFTTTKDFSVNGQDSNNSGNYSQIYKYVQDAGALVQITSNSEEFDILTFNVSSDGTQVDFLTASNLLNGNGSNFQQIYRYTTDTGISQLTELVDDFGIEGGYISVSSQSLIYSKAGLNRLDYSSSILTIDGSDLTVQLGYNNNLAPVASGDGRYVFFSDQDSAKIKYLDTTTGTLTDVGAITGSVTDAFQTIEVSENGNTAAIVGDLGSGYGLYVYDLEQDTLTKVNTTNTSNLASVAISGDGSTVAYSNNFENKIYSYDVSSNTKTDLTLSKASLSNFVNDQFSLSADGNYLLVESSSNPLGTNANANAELFLYNAEENDLLQITNTSGSALNGNTPVVTNNGDVFFFSSADLTGNGNTFSQLFKYSYDNGSTDQLTSYLASFGNDTTGRSGDLRASTDGKSILFLSFSETDTGASYGDNAIEVLKYDFVSGTTSKLTDNATNNTALNTGSAPQLTDGYLLFVDKIGALGTGENRIYQQAYNTTSGSEYTQGGTTSYLYSTTAVQSGSYSTKSSLLGSGSLTSRGQAVYTLENLKDLKKELEKNIAAVAEARQTLVSSVNAIEQNSDKVTKIVNRSVDDKLKLAKNLASEIKDSQKNALDAHSLEAVLVKALTSE